MEVVKTKLQTMKLKLHEAETSAQAAQDELDEYERKRKELEEEVRTVYFYSLFLIW